MLKLDLNHKPFVGRGRIESLRRIGEAGSISRAAKEMGMSYKQAWDAVDAMNNLAERPVQRQVGGRHGGGTEVTDEGRRLIAVYTARNRSTSAFSPVCAQASRISIIFTSY